MGPLYRTHSEPHNTVGDEFLAKLRFEQRNKLAELPGHSVGGRNGFLITSKSGGMVLERHLSVKATAEMFGYNEQYLRRLLRTRRLEGIKIGQIWLINLESLEAHLRKAKTSRDQRWGPQGVTADFAEGVAA